MVQFLDPETAKILQFLDPEIVNMDQKGQQILYDYGSKEGPTL